jgi:hypothetical protein
MGAFKALRKPSVRHRARTVEEFGWQILPIEIAIYILEKYVEIVTSDHRVEDKDIEKARSRDSPFLLEQKGPRHYLRTD